jgi:beta-lactamase regulating signal transducer with metallopeptidase domain
MSAHLGILAEETALRYAVNLALGATSASLVGLLLAAAVRRNAALRQGLLAATLVTLAALPLLLLPEWGVGLLRVGSAAQQASVTRQAASGPEQVLTPQRATISPGVQTWSAANVSPPPQNFNVSGETTGKLATKTVSTVRAALWGGVLVWVTGSVLSGFVVLRSALTLRRLRAGSVDAGPDWEARAQHAAQAVGMRRVPQVAFAAGAVVPFALGGRRPLILLPETARDLEAREAEAILLHEAGHLAHRHALLGAIMATVGAVYWWLPPVHRVNSALSDAMEEVCDNHVIQVQGDGHALGRCLVRAAEAAATGVRMLPGSAILHSKRGMSRRLTRILEADRYRQTTLTRFGRVATVFVVLACLGVCGLVRITPLAAQERAYAWTAYFPMTVGTEWTYRATYAGQEKPGEHILRVRRRVPLKDGNACAEIETTYDGRRGGFLYSGLRKDGYYVYHNAFIGMPGVSENEPPMPQVKPPLKKGQNWTWYEAWRGQVMADESGNAPDTSNWGTNCKATIEAIDAAVTVPAGRYRALRVRIERNSTVPDFGRSEEIVWYAKGVGVVRREGRKPGQQEPTLVFALTRFVPGQPKAAMPENILPLVRNSIVGAAPRTLREIDLGGGAFLSRFAAAQWGDRRRLLYRVSARGSQSFDPQRPSDWNRLFAEDRAEKPPFGGSVSRWAALKDMGILMAESLGFDTDAKTEVDQVTTRENPDGSTEMIFAVRRHIGVRNGWGVRVRMEVSKQREITDLRLESWRE